MCTLYAELNGSVFMNKENHRMGLEPLGPEVVRVSLSNRVSSLISMQDKTKPLVEIAEQLGFSELSAFSRAFKRWMGTSPAEYRSVRLS